jgi:hypothetical protein
MANGNGAAKQKPVQKPIYETIWRAKWTVDGATTVGEMVKKLVEAGQYLLELEAAGVSVDHEVTDDYAYLLTDDPAGAQQFGFTLRADEDD